MRTKRQNESSGLYVHVPFCDGKCAYCAFYSVRYAPGLAETYLRGLTREMERRFGEHPDFQPDTVYIGGGTPTILTPDQWQRLCDLVRRVTGRRAIREWTVEANPGSLTAKVLRSLMRAGVNRISLGAQSFDAATLRRLGRRHTPADIRRACAILREEGLTNFGVDLIACVPGVTAEGWRATLGTAMALGPRHISVYALTVEEGSRLFVAAQRREFQALSDGAQLAMLHDARRLLKAQGYRQYEISNFAMPGFECAHNLACWRGRDYIGLGPAAASRVGCRHTKNRPDLGAYVRALEAGRMPPADVEILTPERAATDDIVFGLRMTEGVDPDAIATRHGLRGHAVHRHWLNRLEFLRVQKLARLSHGAWSLTSRGLDLADAIAVELM